jgi:hypothetical protein
LLDLGRSTFGDSEAQIHTITVHWRCCAHHFGTVQAAADVLPLEFLLSLVSKRFVIGSTFGQTHLFQSLDQDILVKLLEPNELYCGHRWALFNHDNQHITLGLEAHILEQTECKKSANGCSAFLIRILIAHPQRQRSKNSTGLNALQTLNADIAHSKRIHSPGRHTSHQGRHHCQCSRLNARTKI